MSEVKRFDIEGHDWELIEGRDWVISENFDRVTAELDAALGREAASREEFVRQLQDVKRERDHAWNARDALQQRLNAADQREDDRSSLEQRHRAEFEACQAAERRVEVLEGFLSSATKRFGLADKQPDLRYAILELLNPTAEDALKPAEATDDTCEFCKGWGFSSNSDGADEGCGACNGTGKEPAEGGGDDA